MAVEPQRYAFPKSERICSELAFAYLFEHGSSRRVGVLKVFYALNPPPELCPLPLMVALTAPKRRFKRAVDRNHLKRRLREAYRLHRHPLSEALQARGQRMLLLIAYQHRERVDHDRIRRSLAKALYLLIEELEKNHVGRKH